MCRFNSPHITIPVNNSLTREFNSPVKTPTPSSAYASSTLVKKTCHCKQSKCLKLYCDCFAAGIFCQPNYCACRNCCNNPMYEKQRNQAIENVLSRDPNAFRSKSQEINDRVEIGRIKGCNCKKSYCLKKYCECYSAGLSCNDNCKCIECKNYESKFRRNHLAQVPNPPLNMINKPPNTPLLTFSEVQQRIQLQQQQQQQQQQIPPPLPPLEGEKKQEEEEESLSLTIPLPPSQLLATDIHIPIPPSDSCKSPISSIITPTLLEDITKKLIFAYLTSEVNKEGGMDNNESGDMFNSNNNNNNNNSELYCYEVLKSDRYCRSEKYILTAYATALNSINEILKDYSRLTYGANNHVKYNPSIINSGDFTTQATVNENINFPFYSQQTANT